MAGQQANTPGMENGQRVRHVSHVRKRRFPLNGPTSFGHYLYSDIPDWRNHRIWARAGSTSDTSFRDDGNVWACGTSNAAIGSCQDLDPVQDA